MNAPRLTPSLFLAVAIGCAGPESPTTPLTTTNRAIASVEVQDHGEHGAVIVRSSGIFLITAVDFERNLLVTHGWTDGFPGMCGDPVSEVTFVSALQLLTNPSDENLVMQLLQLPDAYVRVHPWLPRADGSRPTLRQTICGGPVLYRGLGQAVRMDNDLTPGGTSADRERTNAFGFTAQGRLNDAAGNGYHYNAIQKFVLDIADDGTTARFRQVRTVNVVPVGND